MAEARNRVPVSAAGSGAAATVPVRSARRVRLGDQVYEQILQGIVSGDYVEGQRLPSENVLAKAFGVSRSIVREALFRLQVDGVVTARQGSGSYVQHRPSEEFFEHAPPGAVAEVLRFFELRVAIEGEVAYHAATRRTEMDLARIEAINARLEAIIGAGEMGVEIDIELHEAIAATSRNDLFVLTLRNLRSLYEAGLRMTRGLSLKRQPERQRLVQDEHASIISAIADRDPDRARTAMRHHIDNARMRLLAGSRVP